MYNDAAIMRFFRDDIGGILITDAAGNVLYEDKKMAMVRRRKTNWQAACPPPRPDQKGEIWDLLDSDIRETYMVITSTFTEEGQRFQIHHLVDTSLYMGLYRDITQYSRTLKNEKERDSLTGLYNKGKFLEMKRSLFEKQETVAVFNMDVNNLKYMNDHFGHDTGDKLIRKAAESLKKIEARNVIPFRMGGDEFVVVAVHVSRDEAEKILKTWEEELEALNLINDGVPCVIACGLVYGEKDMAFDEVMKLADQRMYENKISMKRKGSPGMREIR